MAELATAGLDSIAVRVPDHPVARDILRAFGRPVVAPSANRSGHVSPTTAAHVLADLGGRIDLIVDGGPAEVGVESTIVACLDATDAAAARRHCRARRSSACSARALADPPAGAIDPEAPLAPGMLASHYAPRARLRLNATRVEQRRSAARLRPGTLPPGAEAAARVLNLSHAGDLVEAAANLFSDLRPLDAAGVATIAVMPMPHDGLGEAINDRLARAAAPRESPA